MAWQDSYQQGSYRGVKFYTEEHSATFGRRRAVYEIPYDDRGVASRDIGRRPRKFNIEAILVGPDYNLDRDALIKVIELADAGLLVHPYLGQVMVLIEDFDLRESTKNGGCAEIRFTAIESRAKAETPVAAPPAQRASLPAKVAAVKLANAEAFEANFTLKDVADFVRSANIAQLDTALQNLRVLNGGLSAVLSIPGNIASEIDAISLQVVSLIDTPRKLFDTIEGTLDKVFQSIGRVAGRFGIDVDPDGPAARPVTASLSYRGLVLATQADLMSGVPQPGTRDTPARAQERKNFHATANAMRTAALAATVDATQIARLPSRTEALVIRDKLLDLIEALILEPTLDPTVFEALEDLRASVRLTITGDDLQTLTEFVPQTELPADVIAYELYGDAERSAEITDRNSVSDPGAVPGFQVLEVLSA